MDSQDNRETLFIIWVNRITVYVLVEDEEVVREIMDEAHEMLELGTMG